jgi:hypothetical protein
MDVALTIAHLLPGVGIAATVLPAPVKLAVWIVLALSLFRLLLRQRRMPATLKLQADGRLFLLDNDGNAIECRIDPATTVMPWLIVLRFKIGQTLESMILPVDAVEAEGHRQLRTWLRWRANVDPG